MVDRRNIGDVTEVCGLRVGGQLRPFGRTASGTADLVMDAGPVVEKPGEVERLDGADRLLTLRQVGQMVFVRFPGLAVAAVDMTARTATIEVTSGSPPGTGEVLAAGPVLALALAIRGECVLHASAVCIGGRAVAFAAPSGGGKSTMAALACLAGAELVADDTLVLALDDSEIRCLPGSRELRLRPASAELLTHAPWPRRTTADARVAVLAGREKLVPPAMAAIVLPVIDEEAAEGIERVRGAVAARLLLRCSRLVALRVPGHSQAMLELAATLAYRIPVYRITMRRLSRAHLPDPVTALLHRYLGNPG